MERLILEGGDNPALIQGRGLFSFVIQFVSVHRAYFLDENDYKISFDLRGSSYSTCAGNHWDLFFEQETFDQGQRTVWAKGGNTYGYSFDFNNLKEKEIAKSIIQRYLILKPEIQNLIDDFSMKHFTGKKILGIHKRGTDIGMHHQPASLDSFFELVDQKIGSYDSIFLSTDEKYVVDRFKDRYPNVLNVSYDTLSSQSNLPNFKTTEGKLQGYQVGVDAILDAFLLAKTDFLIKGNSNLSNFSLLANPELEFVFI